jgi:hypothetical protein
VAVEKFHPISECTQQNNKQKQQQQHWFRIYIGKKYFNTLSEIFTGILSIFGFSAKKLLGEKAATRKLGDLIQKDLGWLGKFD